MSREKGRNEYETIRIHRFQTKGQKEQIEMVHLLRTIHSSFVEHQSRNQFDSSLPDRKESSHKDFSFILKANGEEEESEKNELFTNRKAMLAEKESLSKNLC